MFLALKASFLIPPARGFFLACTASSPCHLMMPGAGHHAPLTLPRVIPHSSLLPPPSPHHWLVSNSHPPFLVPFIPPSPPSPPPSQAGYRVAVELVQPWLAAGGAGAAAREAAPRLQGAGAADGARRRAGAVRGVGRGRMHGRAWPHAWEGMAACMGGHGLVPHAANVQVLVPAAYCETVRTHASRTSSIYSLGLVQSVVHATQHDMAWHGMAWHGTCTVRWGS